MKNIKYFIGVLLAIVVLLPNSVFAYTGKVIVNQNGVKIPSDVYNNLLKIFSEKHIDVLTQAEYQDILDKDIDFDSVVSSDKYIKTVYNNVTGESKNYEVSKEEYENYNPGPQVRTASLTTTYKRISLNVTDTGQGTAFMTFSAYWRIMPATRSFDVIAARMNGFTKVNGTQAGRQIYTDSNGTNTITYGWNGTNINNQSNGFGISMNLVNQSLTYLECNITSDMIINVTHPLVAASYQHSTQDISLAISKSYTLGAGGLGNVIIFSNGYGSYFDGMNGVYEQL